MKKLYLLLFTVFLNLAFFSCTPNSIEGNGSTVAEEGCCGDDVPIPPPPPPGGGG